MLLSSQLRALAPVLWLTLGASVPLAAREIPDLPYVTGSTERQKLDLYLPETAPGGAARPLVVFVHGGAWQAGSRRDFPGGPLVARGLIVASLGYRLSQDAKYPAQIEDLKAAIRWLRAHAGEYGIDPHRVGAWGESAGGHLAALLGTTGHEKRFDVGENLDQSSAVQCVLDWFGPSDFLHWGNPPVMSDSRANQVSQLLGVMASTHPDAAKAASPVDFVDKNSAPFLIMHGDKDGTVPLQQSQVLDAALRKAGVESRLVVVPGAGHGGPGFNTPEINRQVDEFFDRHLGPISK